MNTARNTIIIDDLFKQTKDKVDNINNKDNVVSLNNSLLSNNHSIIENPVLQEIIKPETIINKETSYLTNKEAPTKSTSLNWIKNVIIGAGKTYYERLSMFTNPISFIIKNISTIITGLFYVSLPAILSFYFLYSFPQYRTNLITGGFSQLVSILGLYISFAFMATLGILFLRTLSLGLVRMLNNFANKGKSTTKKYN